MSPIAFIPTPTNKSRLIGQMSELFQRITVAIYFFLNCSSATRVNPCAAPTIFNLFRFATIALGNRKLKTEEDAKWWLMSYRWVFDAWLWQCYAWSFHQFILAHPSPRSLDHHQRIWSETTCQTYTKKIYTDTCNQFICLFFFLFCYPSSIFFRLFLPGNPNPCSSRHHAGRKGTLIHV